MTNNHLTLKELRKAYKVRQEDLADVLGMNRTTFAYKEQTDGFTDREKAAIAKRLKTDVQYIVWTKTSTGKVTDDKDKIIKEQREEIIQLKAEVKILQEMVNKFMQNR